MPKTVPNPPPGFDKLSVEEKIDYVQNLWGHIAASPEKVPVPEWHLRVLKDRMESYKAGRSKFVPWPEARAELMRRLRDRRPK